MKANKFLTLIAIAISTIVNAQVDLTNTGVLRISTGSDILFINGNFTNTSAGSLTNNGQLHVKQNLTNDQSAMSAGTGILYLTGSAAQSVSGTQIFKTFDL